MGEPIAGSWRNSIAYTGAQKWGTGINPIHAQRMGEPRGDLNWAESGMSPAHHEPYSTDYIEMGSPWGYQPEDIAGIDIYGIGATETFHQDDWPSWDTSQTGGTSANRMTTTIEGVPRPAYTAPRAVRAFFRGLSLGAWSNSPLHDKVQSAPTNTVGSGWINKPASGMDFGEVADAEPSADAQIFVRTSMTQRYKSLNNDRAVMRSGPTGTVDTPRAGIDSRIAPMKLKIYPGEDRLYDMFPRQQDQKPRPFWYRNAATGPLGYMTNPQDQRTAIQRTPPPDPSLGVPDTHFDQYGYSNEDLGYY